MLSAVGWGLIGTPSGMWNCSFEPLDKVSCAESTGGRQLFALLVIVIAYVVGDERGKGRVVRRIRVETTQGRSSKMRWLRRTNGTPMSQDHTGARSKNDLFSVAVRGLMDEGGNGGKERGGQVEFQEFHLID